MGGDEKEREGRKAGKVGRGGKVVGEDSRCVLGFFFFLWFFFFLRG